MNYIGDFTTADTVYVLFHTFDSNDPSASVTLTGLAVTDIEIYKDGSVTQRSSDAGYTLLDTDGIDFDGITGIHGFSIDLSNNTDAGFFSAGSDYHVVVSSVTVDGATINFVAAHFSIENRSFTTPLSDIESSLVVITSDTTAIHSQTTVIESDSIIIESSVQAVEVDTSTTLSAQITTIASDVVLIYSDTTAIHSQTTVIESDSIIVESSVQAVEVDTSTTLSAQITTIASDLVLVYSDTTAIHSQTTVIESDSIAVESSVAVVESQTTVIESNTEAIHSQTTVIEVGASTIVSGAAEAGTLSTTQMTSNLTEATDDHYIGRVVIWTSGVLVNQASDITDYAGATGMLTYTAVTEAPSAADTFIIV